MDVFDNLAKFTGKHLCWSFFFNKFIVLSSATLSKKRLRHRSFTVNFANVLRTPLLRDHFRATTSEIVPKLSKKKFGTSHKHRIGNICCDKLKFQHLKLLNNYTLKLSRNNLLGSTETLIQS